MLSEKPMPKTQQALKRTVNSCPYNQLVSRLFGEVFNQHAVSVIDELYDPNVVDRAAFPDQAPGVAGIKSAINGFFDR
jgi:hypothetical protein